MELKQFGVGESLTEKLAGLDLRDEVLEFRTTGRKFESRKTLDSGCVIVHSELHHG
jgi:hypothetical protein